MAGLQAFGAIEKTVQEETSAAGETVRLPRHTHTRGDSDTSEMVQKCVAQKCSKLVEIDYGKLNT